MLCLFGAAPWGYGALPGLVPGLSTPVYAVAVRFARTYPGNGPGLAGSGLAPDPEKRRPPAASSWNVAFRRGEGGVFGCRRFDGGKRPGRLPDHRPRVGFLCSSTLALYTARSMPHSPFPAYSPPTACASPPPCPVPGPGRAANTLCRTMAPALQNHSSALNLTTDCAILAQLPDFLHAPVPKQAQCAPMRWADIWGRGPQAPAQGRCP